MRVLLETLMTKRPETTTTTTTTKLQKSDGDCDDDDDDDDDDALLIAEVEIGARWLKNTQRALVVPLRSAEQDSGR